MSAEAQASEKFSVALRINWTVVSLGLVFLAILVRLGFWQLERAEEKQQLLAYIEHQQSLPALLLGEASNSGGPLAEATASNAALSDEVKYRQVSLSGAFDGNRYWLLDNQVHQGVVGYHVLGLFTTQHGLHLLVNRGWIPAPQHREQFPTVSFPVGPQTVTGRLVVPSENPLALSVAAGQGDHAAGGWPVRVQNISLAEVEQTIRQSLFPSVVQLVPDDSAALVMEWRDINVSVSKHRGYAFQWFAMAIALVIALIFANTNLARLFASSSSAAGRDEVEGQRQGKTNHTQRDSEGVGHEQ